MQAADLPPLEPDETATSMDAAWPAAAAAVAAFIVCVWLVSGVTAKDSLLYLGYLAGFVALPGIFACSVVRRCRRLRLEHICAGIPLGFTLVILGFILFSALGLRRLAPYASPLVGAVALGVQLAWRTGPSIRLRRPGRSRKDVWILAAMIVVAILFVTVEFFPRYPLPERLPAGGTDYQIDVPWHISNAAGLKSFWPPVDMRAVEVPLHYYVGVHIHAAAASLVTGVELAALFLRLDLPVFIALLGLQLFWLGRQVCRRWEGGLLTAAIALLAGDLSILHGGTATLYLNLFTRNTFLSPTYALGLLLFLPIVISIGRFIADESESPSRLVLAGLLCAGLAWIKVPALPVAGAACAGVATAEIVFRRRLPKRPLIALALVAVALAAMWPFVVMPGGGGYVRLEPLATFGLIPAYGRIFGGDAGGALTAPLRALATILGHAPVAMAGLAALFACRRSRDDAFARWLAMVVLAGASAALLFNGAGVGQLWFWLYAYVALAALAALGYLTLVDRYKPRLNRVHAALAGVITLAAIASSVSRAYPGFLIAIGRRLPSPGALTPARAEALRWIRANTPPDAILAIDQFKHVYGSALSERRFLLEQDHFMPSSYLYRFTQGKQGKAPREDLRTLIRGIFEEGDPTAIGQARDQYGVRYLLHDKQIVPGNIFMPPSLAHKVFSNDAIDVYEVRE